jgi:hypothetical protein
MIEDGSILSYAIVAVQALLTGVVVGGMLERLWGDR